MVIHILAGRPSLCHAKVSMCMILRRNFDLHPNDFASSGESVGEFWLGQATKSMKQRDFDGFRFPVPESLSGDQLYFGVEAFDHA